MTKKPKKPFVARVYLGQGEYRWVGRYATRKERDREKAKALLEIREARPADRMLVREYAARFLRDYAESNKASSADTARGALKPFLGDFGGRELRSITRIEAKDWAHKAKQHWLPVVVTLFNQAIDDELLEKNPFRGLGRRTDGRSDDDPPTEEQFSQLLAACDALGGYGPRFRAMLLFAAHSGLRPGELFALEWTDVDFDRMRIVVARRVYRGSLDVPKSGVDEIVLMPEARDALLTLPRDRKLVFLTKTGRRMSQPILSGDWRRVLARAGLEFDFYHSTRHLFAHWLLVSGLPERLIAQQMRHELDGRMRWKLKKVYGHASMGALDEIDSYFKTADVRPLRPVQDASGDANGA